MRCYSCSLCKTKCKAIPLVHLVVVVQKNYKVHYYPLHPHRYYHLYLTRQMYIMQANRQSSFVVVVIVVVIIINMTFTSSKFVFLTKKTHVSE